VSSLACPGEHLASHRAAEKDFVGFGPCLTGMALLPRSIEDVLPSSVVIRPLSGEQPTIDLMVGDRRDNPSSIPRVFVDKLEELLARMALEPVRRQSFGSAP
jgi:hypothetical protein